MQGRRKGAPICDRRHLQWRSWCLDPDYLFGVMPAAARGHYAALELPLRSLSFTDDEYLSERNIQSLHGLHAGASKRG